MKQIKSERVSSIARDDTFWQGFPGLCLTRSGGLALGYKQAHGHGASRWARVVVRTSDDRGRSWSEPQVLASGSFDTNGLSVATSGVYLTALRSGTILLTYYNEQWPTRRTRTACLHRSVDDGKTWSEAEIIRLGDEPGTVWDGYDLECRNGELLRLSGPVNMRLFRSSDEGRTWGSPVVAFPSKYDIPLELGEACLSELPDGRTVMILRECAFADTFPACSVTSCDGGLTWSRPQVTPFHAHWPSSFALPDGRHIIAYRNLGGRSNSVVWCGRLADLPGYQVASCRYNNSSAMAVPSLEGLVIDNDGEKGQFTQFYLLHADSDDADVEIEAEVRCLSNAGHACAIGLRRCGWLRIFPDHIDVEHIPGESVVKLDGTAWHTYRFARRDWTIHVSVDGREVFAAPKIDLAPVGHAPYNAFGNKFDCRALPCPDQYPVRVRLPGYVPPSNSGTSIWRRVSMTITGNRWLDDCRYEWHAGRDGPPDRWQEENLLELDYCRDASDWGKPVVVCWPDGECFAVDYFSNGAPVGFASLAFTQPGRGHNSYVLGYRFHLDDIPGSR